LLHVDAFLARAGPLSLLLAQRATYARRLGTATIMGLGEGEAYPAD
jgi:hypothetical protein